MDITSDESLKKRAEVKGGSIEVRTKEEHEECHLAETDAQYGISNGDCHERMADLDKNETYYRYCRSGGRSEQAARMMRDYGFEKVYNIGGYSDLEAATKGKEE